MVSCNYIKTNKIDIMDEHHEEQTVGFLGVILGCMFSAKTSELVRQLELQHVLGRNVMLVGPTVDTRTAGGDLYVHGMQTPGDHVRRVMRILRLHKLEDAVKCDQFGAAHMIGVDEGQFFDDLVPAVQRFLSLGKTVWVAGLNGSWSQRPLGHMLHLIPLADDVLFLRALCMDCRDGTLASFTCRREAKTTAVADLDIGAGDKYVPVCRYHMQARRGP